MAFRIADSKITHYLLSTKTKKSAAKCKFFTGAGYFASNWTVLRDDLLQHPDLALFEGSEDDTYGMKFLYRCSMPIPPNGKPYCLRTVWQLKSDGDVWFLTA